MYIPVLALTCSMYEPLNVKPKLTSRMIKIEKHEFICNLRFCNVRILFVTTCKSNTARHAITTTVPFYNISALYNRNKR